jgi:hypothetical protein
LLGWLQLDVLFGSCHASVSEGVFGRDLTLDLLSLFLGTVFLVDIMNSILCLSSCTSFLAGPKYVCAVARPFLDWPTRRALSSCFRVDRFWSIPYRPVGAGVRLRGGRWPNSLEGCHLAAARYHSPATDFLARTPAAAMPLCCAVKGQTTPQCNSTGSQAQPLGFHNSVCHLGPLPGCRGSSLPRQHHHWWWRARFRPHRLCGRRLVADRSCQP